MLHVADPPLMPRTQEGPFSTLQFLARAAGLLVGLTAASALSAWDPRLIGLGVATWALLGWQAKQPRLMACITAAITASAALWVWPTSPAFLVFAPLWAAFWIGLAEEKYQVFFQAKDDPRRTRSLALMASAIGHLVALPSRNPRRGELIRVLIVMAGSVAALAPFLHDGIMGGDDGKWYTAVVADHLIQWRQHLAPVFVGETPYAAFGTVFPLRVAPYLQHFTVLIDLLSGRQLAPYLLLNLAVFFSGVAGGLSAYFSLRTLLPQNRTEASLLALLYAWCPAVVGLAYSGQLFMSTMTWPFLPLVFTALVHVCRGGGIRARVALATGCAGCWLAHSPIGFWTTAMSVLVLGIRWLSQSGKSRQLRSLLLTLALGVGLCGYVFVSFYFLHLQKGPPLLAEDVLRTIQATFPNVVLPVSRGAGLLSDLQLGYGLWALLAACCWLTCTARRSAITCALAVVSVLLTLLLLPVPVLTAALWKSIPQMVVNVTDGAAGQRLYPILAACTVSFAALTLDSYLKAFPLRRAAVLLVLAVGVLWSGFELQPFLKRGKAIAVPKEQSEIELAPENLALSRYSVSLLTDKNAFFSHGVMDFPLEQRVLGRDFKNYIVTNVGSIAPGFEHGPAPAAEAPLTELLTGRVGPKDNTWMKLEPKIVLQPGVHYLLVLQFPKRPLHGILQFTGKGFYREYVLPYSGEKYAFGSEAPRSRYIPLWTSSTEPVEIDLEFLNTDQNADLKTYASFARYELIPYDPQTLPVRLQSYMPYEALVNSPEDGWLETFRYYTEGWSAMVNGAPRAVRRSTNGLVAVPIEHGESRVTLNYSPPLLLWLFYGLMCLSWLGVSVFYGHTVLQQIRSRPISEPSPGEGESDAVPVLDR